MLGQVNLVYMRLGQIRSG